MLNSCFVVLVSRWLQFMKSMEKNVVGLVVGVLERFRLLFVVFVGLKFKLDKLNNYLFFIYKFITFRKKSCNIN